MVEGLGGVAYGFSAMVLAAGVGVRMRQTAMWVPKTVAELGPGLVLGEAVVASLWAAGASRLCIVVLPGWEKAYEAMASRWGLDYEIVVNERWWAENGLSLVLGAKRCLAGEQWFLVSMADHIYEPGLARLVVQEHLRRGAPGCTVAADPKAPLVDHAEATRIRAGREGLVEEIGKRLAPYTHIDTGVMAFSRWALEARDWEEKPLRLAEIVAQLAREERAWIAEVDNVLWADVDTDEELADILQGPQRIVLERLLEELHR